MNAQLRLNDTVLTMIGMMLSPFLMGSLRVLGYVGITLMLIGLFMSATVIKLDNICKLSISYIIILFARFTYQMITCQTYPSTIRSTILQILTFVFIILARGGKYTYYDWKKLLDKSSDFFLLIGVFLFVTNRLEYSPYFGTMYGNVLLVTFGVKLLSVLDQRRLINIAKLVIALVFIYYTEMRSALVGALVGLIYIFLPSAFIKNYRVNLSLFVVVISLCYLVPYIYLELFSPSTNFTALLSLAIQNIVYSLTGRRFFSGRNDIWPYILMALNGKQLFGGGIGFNPSQIYDTTHSAHNLFLFIRCEQGLFGLSIFILLLYSVWKQYTIQSMKKITVAAQSIFLAIMIQQTFSLGLLGGKGAFSFISWALLIACTKRDNKLIENKESDYYDGY